MRKTVLLFFLTAFCASCNEKAENEKPTLKILMPATSIQPENRAVINEGAIVFEKDTFTVFSEYTDDIAFIQATKDMNGKPSSLKYRGCWYIL